MKRRIHIQPGTYELRKISPDYYDRNYNQAFVSSHRAISDSCQNDDETDRKTSPKYQHNIFPDSTSHGDGSPSHNSSNSTTDGVASNKDRITTVDMVKKLVPMMVVTPVALPMVVMVVTLVTFPMVVLVVAIATVRLA